MKFGLHLPLIDWGGAGPGSDPAGFVALGVRAEQAGFDTVAANDHLVFARPWFDGPTALAAVAVATSSVRLMTTVALPVVRGPFALAKTLAAVDLLSGGRVVAGVGPGSSARDYALAGIPFEERWPRFDESVRALRAAWTGDQELPGRFYSTEGVRLEPRPATPDGPPIWIGSWGSAAGLRRVARLADGWLASAYNTTPEDFSAARSTLHELVAETGRPEATLPNALATAWMAVTDDAAEARRIVHEVIAPAVGRPADQLADRLLVGPASAVADRLAAYAEAGLEQAIVWPVVDVERQLDRFAERIMPAFRTAGAPS